MSNVILYATGKTEDNSNYALKCSPEGILEVSATITTSAASPIETKTVLYADAENDTKISVFTDTVDSTISLFTHDKQNAINTSTLNTTIGDLNTTMGTNNTDVELLTETLVTTNENTTTLNDNLTTINSSLTSIGTLLDTNNTTLGDNSTALTTNSGVLVDNNTNLSNNSSALTANSSSLGTNSSSLGTNTIALNSNTGVLGSNSTALGTNSSALSTNSQNLATNSTNLSLNTQALTTNNSNMTSNTTSLTNNTSALTTNNTNMVTNSTNLSNNTSALTSNNGFLSTNNSNLNTNNQNLASNTTTVGLLNGKLDTLNTNLGYLTFTSNELKTVSSETTSSVVVYGSNYDTATPDNNPLYVDASGFITANINSTIHENITIGYSDNIASMSVLSSGAWFLSFNPVSLGEPGFFYNMNVSHSSVASLLWYNNGPYGSTSFPSQSDFSVKNIDIFYVIMKNYNPESQSYINMNIYTKPTGSGDYCAEYRSKFTYILNGSPFVGYGKSYMLYNGNLARVKNNDTECPRLQYVLAPAGQGPQLDTEIVGHIEIEFYNPGGIIHKGVVVEGGVYVKNTGLLNYYFQYDEEAKANYYIGDIKSQTDRLTFVDGSNLLQTASAITDVFGNNPVDIISNSSSTQNLKTKKGLVTDSVLYGTNSSGDVKALQIDTSGNLNVNLASGSISVSSVKITDSSGNNITAQTAGGYGGLYTGYLNTFNKDIYGCLTPDSISLRTTPQLKVAGSSPATYADSVCDSNGSLNVNIASQAFNYLGGLNNVLNNVTIASGGYNPSPAFDVTNYGNNSVLTYVDTNSTGATNFRVYLYAINMVPSSTAFGNTYCIGVLDPVWYSALARRVTTVTLNLAPYKSLFIYSPEGQVNNVCVSLAY